MPLANSSPSSIPCILPVPPLQTPPSSDSFQAAASEDQVLTLGVAEQLLFQFATTPNALAYSPYASFFRAPTSGTYFFMVVVAWFCTSAGVVLTLSLNVAGLIVLSSSSFNHLGEVNTAVLSGMVTMEAQGV
jgi:hypothetical protein